MLRPLKDTDAENLFYACWDEGVYKYLYGYYCDTMEKARNLIAFLKSETKAFVISTNEVDFVGLIVAVETEDNNVEFSYLVSERYRRCGYAFSAVQELMKSYKGYKIFFQIEADNKSSLRVAKKLGVKPVEKGRGNVMYYVDNL